MRARKCVGRRPSFTPITLALALVHPCMNRAAVSSKGFKTDCKHQRQKGKGQKGLTRVAEQLP